MTCGEKGLLKHLGYDRLLALLDVIAIRDG